MYLHFPQADTLQLAMTSGAASAALSGSPAQAGYAEDGSVWLLPNKKPNRAALKKLGEIGVESSQTAPIECEIEASCWQQLVRLEQGDVSEQIGEKTVVLFELPKNRQLPEIINEILRLGNDRQSYRLLSDDDASYALLKVIGPPYYTLLRALEHHYGADSPRAFYEQSSRVWVEVGALHPMAATLTPPSGQLLFIRSAHDWRYIDELPFEDIYKVLEFQLPQAPSRFEDAELSGKIKAPLSLAAGGGQEPAELWVLNEDGSAQLDQLVRNSDNQLIQRLSFAVGSLGNQKTVLVRARPSKKLPPVLVLDSVACRPYLKLPNLFVPCDRRVHPPLRRDAIAKLLAQDGRTVTWLEPGEKGEFKVRSILDDAFRPLEEWVDYVLEQEQETLTSWMSANVFEFEPFVCEDGAAKPTKERKKQSAKTPRPRKEKLLPVEPKSSKAKKTNKDDIDTTDFVAEKLVAKEPSKMEARLLELQEEFLASDSALDSEERVAIWQELGDLNGALQRYGDATICWSNALWEESEIPPERAGAWLETERLGGVKRGLTPTSLKTMCEHTTGAMPREAATLAAYLTYCAANKVEPTEIVENIGPLSQFLESQELYLPVRTTWLAWMALTDIAHDDVLALARARDRLLERLYQQGMRPEFDMPTFARAGASGDNTRFNLIRGKLGQLRGVVSKWTKEAASSGTARTKAYVDLIFAFGLARLGEASEAEKALDEAKQQFDLKDPIHGWFYSAFEFRIRAALDGRATDEQFAQTLLDKLADIERTPRYKIDRLLQNSRVLEPHATIDPYRRWLGRYPDDLGRELAELFDENDREVLKESITSLLQRYAPKKNNVSLSYARVVTTALELAPRLGESAAVELLALSQPLLSAKLDLIDRAAFLKQGLFVAAHFDRVEDVHQFVAKLEDLIPELVDAYLLTTSNDSTHDDTAVAVESLLSRSFRGLRKLGMRDEIAKLFGRIAELARSHQRKNPSAYELTQSHKLLLHIAASWFYFGQTEPAEAIIHDVRKTLYHEELIPAYKAQVTCSYLHALGQSPMEYGLPAMEELFGFDRRSRRLDGIHDAFSTGTHFALLQLNIVETLVLSLASDSFVLDADSRRWMDEDEFLVRRRIHRDVRNVMRNS